MNITRNKAWANNNNVRDNEALMNQQQDIDKQLQTFGEQH